jgi:Fur family ferric uptake transcriptional regulator
VSRPDRASKLILQVLQQHHALTAPEIIDLLQQTGSQLNKTSVYRALERLLESEEVCRHMFGGQIARYELRETHHDHLVCTVCGQITAVPCVVTIPDSYQGWQIDHHHLTLFGVCERCSTQKGTADQSPTSHYHSVERG